MLQGCCQRHADVGMSGTSQGHPLVLVQAPLDLAGSRYVTQRWAASLTFLITHQCQYSEQLAILNMQSSTSDTLRCAHLADELLGLDPDGVPGGARSLPLERPQEHNAPRRHQLQHSAAHFQTRIVCLHSAMIITASLSVDWTSMQPVDSRSICSLNVLQTRALGCSRIPWVRDQRYLHKWLSTHPCTAVLQCNAQ